MQCIAFRLKSKETVLKIKIVQGTEEKNEVNTIKIKKVQESEVEF